MALNLIKLKKLVEKIRYFCKKVHSSSKLTGELKAHQAANKEPSISVVMDIEIRWNSTHDMLSVASRIKKSLTAISFEICEATSSFETTCPITTEDWTNCDLIVYLLEPYYQSKFFQLFLDFDLKFV